ncbi:MAG: aspartate kinase [Parvularculaceae bacterium]
MKFGGTSVGDLERIRRVADRVIKAVEGGDRVAVVVSAMSGETNRLAKLAAEAGTPAPALGAEFDEFDVIVASGEQVSAALLARTLQARGFRARSWLGWQAPIRTDDRHGAARIVEINPTRLCASLDSGEIAVVAGFQGVGPDNRITTMGRGASDLTAVAVAAAIGADRCDIFTDVDGVYTTDPNIASRAQKIAQISYEEMLEMAAMGAKVLQSRAVELAMARRVRVRVLSTFNDDFGPGVGTIVCDESEIVEKRIVSGIPYSRNEARVSLLAMSDSPGTEAELFRLLAEAEVNVDMIVKGPSRIDGAANLTFTVERPALARTVELLSGARERLGYVEIVTDAGVSKISVVGVGMKTHAGVAATMFETLSEKGIGVHAVSTSEIKISVLVDEKYTELAVHALHTAYGLDAPAT